VAVMERETMWVQDVVVPSQKTCLANAFKGSPEPKTVAAQQQSLTQARVQGYEPCGKKMRKHADGEWYCSIHGWMH
jgi:hypothetical protein